MPHVPLRIEVPAAAPQPVACGLPLPGGWLAPEHSLALRDPRGQTHPVQCHPLARWPDGSPRWLLVEFLLPADAPPGDWQLAAQPTAACPTFARALTWSRDRDHWSIDAGPLQFRVPLAGPWTFNALRPDGTQLCDTRVAGPIHTGLVLADRRERPHRAEIVACSVECEGPFRGTLRVDLAFPTLVEARRDLRALLRLDFYADTGLCRHRLTLHNTRRARHRGGMWDLGDSGSLLFRDLSFVWQFNASRPLRGVFQAEPGDAPADSGSDPLEIYQDSSGGENWHSINHLNRDGRVRSVFPGYRIRQPRRETVRRRASPIVAVGSHWGAFALAVPHFWQQFPKAIETRDHTLRLALWPRQFGDWHELQAGEQKTHDAWLALAPTAQPQTVPLAWVHQPAVVRATADWYLDSGAWRYVLASEAIPPNSPQQQFETYVQPLTSGPGSLVAHRETVDEFGWRNWGDWYADHEEQYYPGPLPLISHYNNQYDCVLGSLTQWARSGDHQWWLLAESLARHVIDIDIYHTLADRAAYSGGVFWHTDHYRSAGTSTHRGYSRLNRPPRGAYGGGPSCEQLTTTGLAYYHYLTGDPLARDAVLELADWVCRQEDGRRSWLGVLDDEPTGRASRTAESDYHGPGRGPAHAILALLDAWELCGRAHYLQLAQGLLRRCIHPRDDIDARQLLITEKRWSYTVFLLAVDRFLHLKQLHGQLDDDYHYARASLLHYARWMLDNEKPYFDRPEQLEYPTEAWAAMEFRKANALRLAALHADEPLRQRLLDAGHRLADRAWEDLWRFRTPRTARAVAILLHEGPRDQYFRQAELPSTEPTRSTDFGPPPPEFRSQRARVLRRLWRPWQCWPLLIPGRWLRVFHARRHPGDIRPL